MVSNNNKSTVLYKCLQRGPIVDRPMGSLPYEYGMLVLGSYLPMYWKFPIMLTA